MPLGLLRLHTVPFHPISGSNLGSRKQKREPSSSGLGNKHINLTLLECQKEVSLACSRYDNTLSFSNLVLYTSVVIRTKVKETLVVALHFKCVKFLLPVTVPISVELVRHNVGIFCLYFGELASGCQLIYRFRTEIYFSRQTWIQYMWINSAMLLQVLPPTLITSCPRTLSLVGSSADCGCPGRLWCQHHGTLTYVPAQLVHGSDCTDSRDCLVLPCPFLHNKMYRRRVLLTPEFP